MDTRRRDRQSGKPSQALEHVQGQHRKFGTSMVDNWLIHGPEHTVGHIGRPRNLQKVTARMNHDLSSFEAARL
jgi:hypothetical protein